LIYKKKFCDFESIIQTYTTKKMLWLKRLIFACIGVPLTFVLFRQWSKPAFPEGVITYKVDTVKRIERGPSINIPVEMKLFRKENLLRLETLIVNRFNKADTSRHIQIVNQTGVFGWSEPRSTKAPTAIVLPDWSFQLQSKKTGYQVEKTGQQTTLLGLPVERVLLKSSDGDKPANASALVSTTIDIPIHTFFTAFKQLQKTPLDFVSNESGWQRHYIATAVRRQKLPDELFELPAGMRVKTTKEIVQERKF
jgi:hypothetical protein